MPVGSLDLHPHGAVRTCPTLSQVVSEEARQEVRTFIPVLYPSCLPHPAPSVVTAWTAGKAAWYPTLSPWGVWEEVWWRIAMFTIAQG